MKKVTETGEKTKNESDVIVITMFLYAKVKKRVEEKQNVKMNSKDEYRAYLWINDDFVMRLTSNQQTNKRRKQDDQLSKFIETIMKNTT